MTHPFGAKSVSTVSTLTLIIERYGDVVPHHRGQDKGMLQRRVIPLRLFDCLGLTTPSPLTVVLLDALAVVDDRLGAVFGAGLGMVAVGPLRKADGDGILIVAI